MKQICVRSTTKMVILAILVAASVSCYNTTTTKTTTTPDAQLDSREAILRDTLTQMRKKIDQYAADKQALPGKLQDLVDDEYLRNIPEDPITGKREWQSVMGEDPSLSKGPKGIIDIRSTSTAKSSDGRPYSEW